MNISCSSLEFGSVLLAKLGWIRGTSTVKRMRSESTGGVHARVLFFFCTVLYCNKLVVLASALGARATLSASGLPA